MKQTFLILTILLMIASISYADMQQTVDLDINVTSEMSLAVSTYSINFSDVGVGGDSSIQQIRLTTTSNTETDYRLLLNPQSNLIDLAGNTIDNSQIDVDLTVGLLSGSPAGTTTFEPGAGMKMPIAGSDTEILQFVNAEAGAPQHTWRMTVHVPSTAVAGAYRTELLFTMVAI